MQTPEYEQYTRVLIKGETKSSESMVDLDLVLKYLDLPDAK